MTSRAWAALIASAGLTVATGGAMPALAIHVSTDVPLSIAPEDVQRYREADENEVRQREAKVPRTGRVVLYAGTPEEAAAAYQALREAGHRNVMVLAGGLPAWVRLGFPVETGR